MMERVGTEEQEPQYESFLVFAENEVKLISREIIISNIKNYIQRGGDNGTFII